MVYAVRVSCHINLDIHLNIHRDIYRDIHLNVYRNVHLNISLHLYLILPHLTSSYLRLTSPLTASRSPPHLAPQSVNAIKVHSLVLPSSSTVNLRS